jgi:MYXO-CTERM domain-containing protein
MTQRVLGLRSFVRLSVLSVAFASLGIACASDLDDADPDYHAHGDEETLGTTSSALVATDPVSAAVTGSCSTTSVRGLATQLVDEIQCLRPGTMKGIDKVPGLELGRAVFPFLQAPAADALVAAQKARGVTMTVNSALRALPQQYLLYRWYQTGRCNIRLAAPPGRSNHESAIALDINDNAAWRTAMQNAGFRWFGANDPVHYDFAAGGTVDLRGLSVRAFQRLWNRNNPDDLIVEDGIYGGMTEQRLARSPVGGFAKGAQCNEMPSPEEEPTPRSPEPEEGPDGEPDEERSGGFHNSRNRAPGAESGCAVGVTRSGAPGGLVLALGLVLSAASRRRRR